MASSLETKVLFDYDLRSGQVNELSLSDVKFHTQEGQIPKVKPQIYKQEKVQQEINPSNRRYYSKATISLISAAFILLAGEAVIYFHSVQVQKNSNIMQSKIVEMKEQNYRLNVELAKTKELSRVESVAKNNLQMKPSLTAKINYLILPETVTNKDYLITRVLPEQRKLSIPIGF